MTFLHGLDAYPPSKMAQASTGIGTPPLFLRGDITRDLTQELGSFPLVDQFLMLKFSTKLSTSGDIDPKLLLPKAMDYRYGVWNIDR
jgi:hypothetical protein